MTSSALTEQDKKYWPPIDALTVWLCSRIKDGERVLEIGPGYVPFPKASMFVDYKELPLPKEQTVSVDLNETRLPFADKSYDFIYCRHVLEDMYNPFLLLKEMERVGKAGYIETPSPIAELCRGVDGASPPFRGYHHHRNIVWEYEGELRFIAKYPIVEYIRFSEEDLTRWLRAGAKLWNTYFLWQDTIKWKHIQSGPDFVITRDYSTILKNAMDQAELSAGKFWQEIPEKTSMPPIPQKEMSHV
jgi:Methyltransferase domain